MKRKSIRDIILSTAARLFYKYGYSNTGVNQIIDEAKIAKSSLYQHFRSKEDVLIAYLEMTGEQTVAALKKAAAPYETPLDKLVGIFDYLEGLVTQDDFHGCHFLNLVYEMPQHATRIKEVIKKQKDRVRKMFEEILAPAHKEALADEVYTLFEGALIGNKVHDDPWPIVAAKNSIKKLV